MKQKTQRIVVLVCTSLIIITSFMFISQLNFRSARTEAYEEIQNSGLPLTRENIYSEIIKDLTPAINISSYMANDLFLQYWSLDGEKDTVAIIDYLYNIHNTYNYFSAFFVSEKTAAYYHYSGVLKHVSRQDAHDTWYYNFIDSGRKYDLDVDTNEAANNKLTIFINFRAEDSAGNLLGVTGVGLQMAHFTSMLEDIQNRYNRRVYLVDTNGIIQAHSDSSLIENSNIRDLPGISGIADQLLSASEKPIDFSYETENNITLVTVRYIPEIDWYLIVEQEGETALIAARMNLARTSILGLIITVFTLAIIFIVQRQSLKRLELIASTDTLTGVANRRHFEEHLAQAVYRLSRFDTKFSLIMIDIDNFKQINDNYGHIAGDQAIRSISSLMEKNIRTIDFLARWGGDEFIIIYEGTVKQAEETIKRIMQQMIKSTLVASEKATASITISCGITEYTVDDSSETAIKRADNLLYKAKQKGKNRIITS
ncbi:MAG: GGDEF domain-containing protein [Spirochaetales bacterium]|nr:GGDEF domain-containing protein [Spirochaetales bacterium]